MTSRARAKEGVPSREHSWWRACNRLSRPWSVWQIHKALVTDAHRWWGLQQSSPLNQIRFHAIILGDASLVAFVSGHVGVLDALDIERWVRPILKEADADSAQLFMERNSSLKERHQRRVPVDTEPDLQVEYNLSSRRHRGNPSVTCRNHSVAGLCRA